MHPGRMKDLPRVVLWLDPTPLEQQLNLAQHLGAETVLIKRDDCNGLAFGGNKVRQCEYYLGEAVSQKADTLLITGAVQSNFVRTVAAAAAKLGMDCHIQLENRVANDHPDYKKSGNVFLDRLLGATLHTYPDGEDEEGADANLHAIAEGLKASGKNPYIIHLHPSHPPLGAIGYIDAALELVEQFESLEHLPDRIFVPSGSGNTHAGLLFGLRAAGCSIPVIGICVRRNKGLQRPRLESRMEQIAELLECPSPVVAGDIILEDGFLAPGYGVPGGETLSAIGLAAKKEAIILDPVYTGKTMAGLIDHAQNNPGENLVFIHTGGGPSIFGYTDRMIAIDGQ